MWKCKPLVNQNINHSLEWILLHNTVNSNDMIFFQLVKILLLLYALFFATSLAMAQQAAYESPAGTNFLVYTSSRLHLKYFFVSAVVVPRFKRRGGR